MSKVKWEDYNKLAEAISELRLMESLYTDPQPTPDWVLEALDEVQEVLYEHTKRKWWHI